MAAVPNPLRILIVDDDEDMRWALRLLIASYGHHPILMSRAREALQYATPLRSAESSLDTEIASETPNPFPVTSPPWDLAIVDLKLPDMEGMELIRLLRAMFPNLPCVLVSGYLYGDDPFLHTALHDGTLMGFLPKPFVSRDLRRLVTQLETKFPHFSSESPK